MEQSATASSFHASAYTNNYTAGNLASGGMAGATSLLFVYSLDYARTRLANDAKSAKKGGERQFNGLVDVYRKTLASDGVAGLYRGFGPSVLGIVVYRGLYFGMYDSLKPVILVGPLEGNFLASFLLGWGVTTGAGIASYPLDTIRRRMMMTSGEAVKYSSSMDAARKIMAAEGVKSFFKGAGANILRGVAGAGVLSIYDRKFQNVNLLGVSLTLFPRGPAYPLRQEVQGWFRLDCYLDHFSYDLPWLVGRLPYASCFGDHWKDDKTNLVRWHRFTYTITLQLSRFAKSCNEAFHRQYSRLARYCKGRYIGFIGSAALRNGPHCVSVYFSISALLCHPSRLTPCTFV